MKLAVTGHGPPGLNYEWDGVGPCSDFLRGEFTKIIERDKPAYVFSGMALGTDMIFAECALKLNVHVFAAIPFEGYESWWSARQRKRLLNIINNKLTGSTYTPDPGYEVRKLFIRNDWMLNRCDKLVAVWDGDASGGTFECLKRARIKMLPIEFVHSYKWGFVKSWPEKIS